MQRTVCGWENMPEIEGGEEYLSPLNMVPLDQRGPAGAAGGGE